MKGVAARNAVELAVDWNPDHTCAIKTYAPSLGERSGLSRLFHLLTSPTFFRVYDQQGRLLKSSEWLLWQKETGELEAPQWMGNGRVLYPTTQGYAAWSIPECSTK
ncbi:MAG: hypothetical protein ACXU86_22980 [Archangium sp.]